MSSLLNLLTLSRRAIFNRFPIFNSIPIMSQPARTAEEANKAHYDEHAVNYENLPDVFRLGSQWVSDNSPRLRW